MTINRIPHSGALRAHRPGCYRVTLDAGYFAQIIRCRYTHSAKWGESVIDDASGRFWRAEIRHTTGEIARHAGVHRTLSRAISEAQQIRKGGAC